MGFGFSGKHNIELNLLEKLRKSAYIGVIFDKLLDNKEFAAFFITRYKYYLNGILGKDAVLSKISALEKVYAPEMKEHIDRWRVIGSYGDWVRNMQELKDFAERS